MVGDGILRVSINNMGELKKRRQKIMHEGKHGILDDHDDLDAIFGKKKKRRKDHDHDQHHDNDHHHDHDHDHDNCHKEHEGCRCKGK